jgi:subtilase family serine protease
VSDPPAAAVRGTSFPLTDTVKNQGTAPAGTSTTRYYLSLDTLKSTSDVLLTGTRTVGPLGPGATSAGTVPVTVPVTTVLGTYFLLACADNLGVVAESNETNNCVASAGQVLVTAADLVATAVSDPPAAAVRGTSFPLTDTVKNQGTAPAGTSTTRYYLSLDTVKSTSDVLLTGSRPVGSLGPGASSSGSATVTVPTATVAGSYFLLACADNLVVVAESDETNNCTASAGRVNVSP